MYFLSPHITRFLTFFSALLLLTACATYNQQIGTYYSQVVNNDYEKANASIENIRQFQTERNRLLYLLEKGKMNHLMHRYDSSNMYFNEADLFMEDVRTSAKDIALGTLLNPMMQTYKGEDFEKFMVHYYKALNYLGLGQTDEALVEARRISLQSYAQQEHKRGYSDDAFSLMLQGIIFEQSGDGNNAFIAYRNAADLFLKNKNSWYGTAMPSQLKKDVLRTAAWNGFTDEGERYSRIFEMPYMAEAKKDGGELVLFWEAGLAPVKREQNFFFSLNKDGAGNFVFTDGSGAVNIPFVHNGNFNNSGLNLDDFRSFRVAFPVYEEQPLNYSGGQVEVNGETYSLEGAENINTLAFTTLQERFVKEMSLALSRLAVKKLAEAAVRPKEGDKNKDEKQAVAFALQVFNFVSERADTRNWQSLPHTIFYSRIPLRKGKNKISLRFNNAGAAKTIEMPVDGTGRLQVMNICTLN